MILFQHHKLLHSGARYGRAGARARWAQRRVALLRVPRQVHTFNSRHLLPLLAAAAVGLLTSPLLRHWLIVLVINICVVGGVVAAPVVSVLAWIGMALPTHTLLHEASPLLFGTSLLWLSLAIFGAHAHSVRRSMPR